MIFPDFNVTYPQITSDVKSIALYWIEIPAEPYISLYEIFFTFKFTGNLFFFLINNTHHNL